MKVQLHERQPGTMDLLQGPMTLGDLLIYTRRILELNRANF